MQPSLESNRSKPNINNSLLPTLSLLLLQNGADPQARDQDGRMPLHWATNNENADVITVLVKRVRIEKFLPTHVQTFGVL